MWTINVFIYIVYVILGGNCRVTFMQACVFIRVCTWQIIWDTFQSNLADTVNYYHQWMVGWGPLHITTSFCKNTSYHFVCYHLKKIILIYPSKFSPRWMCLVFNMYILYLSNKMMIILCPLSCIMKTTNFLKFSHNNKYKLYINFIVVLISFHSMLVFLCVFILIKFCWYTFNYINFSAFCFIFAMLPWLVNFILPRIDTMHCHQNVINYNYLWSTYLSFFLLKW